MKPSIVVCGGGMIGALAAVLMADDGHDVVILERDPAPPPADPRRAFAGWDRRGVAQFRQPHNLFPRFRAICDAEVPGLTGALADAGCRWLDLAAGGPPLPADGGAGGDTGADRATGADGDDRATGAGGDGAGAGAGVAGDRYRFVTGRRPVVEAVVAACAADRPGVRVRRGVGAAGLVVDGGPVPHVAGVRTTDGGELRADLVVDAMGRRSPLAGWLAAAGGGGPGPEVRSEDCGFTYYSRWYRGPEVPVTLGPAVQHLGTFSLLTLPGDGDTWSVTLWAPATDAALRAVRDPARFDRVVAACPLAAHWLAGEPTSPVLPMAGVLDRHRRFVVGGRPVATGVVAVGDAWACTNPSAGRGLTVGLVHAQRLRDVVRARGLADREGLAHCWHEVTEREVAPYVHDQIAADRARLAEMDALRRGEDPPPPDGEMAALLAATQAGDPRAFAAVLDIVTCQAPQAEVLARPPVSATVAAHAAATPAAPPGPTHRELLDLLA